MRDGIGEGSQVLVDPPQIVACLPLLGDVTHGGRYQEATAGVDGGQGDLGGEGGAVAAAAGQVQARAHLPGPGIGRVPGAQAGVGGLARVGDQDLDRLPGQFLARVPEQPFGLGVHQHDPPTLIHAHRRVRCRLQQPPEPRISLPLPSDVADGGQHQEAPAGVDGGQGDLGGEGGAVAAAAGQVQARVHLPGPGIGRVPGAQAGVGGLARVGDQDLDRLPGQFLARVPEQPLGLGVHQHDLPTGVHAHRRVRCRLQQPGNDGIADLPHGQARSVLGNLLKVMIPHSSQPTPAACPASRNLVRFPPARWYFAETPATGPTRPGSNEIWPVTSASP